MPTINIKTLNFLAYESGTGWQPVRTGVTPLFGYTESGGCRMVAFQFVCPQFSGSAKKVIADFPTRFNTGSTVTHYFQISLTSTNPAGTEAYNYRVMGKDAGRVATVQAEVTGSVLTTGEYEIPVDALIPGRIYYIVLHARAETTMYAQADAAECRLFYFPVPSTVTLPAETYHYLGDEMTLQINRNSNDVSHRITYTFVDSEGVILETDATSTSVAWTPPLSLATNIPNSMSGECVITCETTLGGELVGTTTVAFELTLKRGAGKPTVTSIKVTPNSENSVVAGWNTFVQGFCKADIVVSASALYGAALTGCKIAVANKTYEGFTATSDVINLSGSVPIYVTVTDSRGEETTAAVRVYVYPYTRPSLNNIICHRSDDTGKYNMDGTNYYAQATAKYSSVGGKNTYVIETRFKTVSGEYGDAETLTSGTGSVCGSGQLSPYTTYVVQILIRDSLYTTPYTVHIPEERNIFKIKEGGRGIGIGVIPTEDDLLDVGLDTRFQGGVNISGEYPTIVFSVGTTIVGEIGSYSDGPTVGNMFIRVYDGNGNHKEYTWSAS